MDLKNPQKEHVFFETSKPSRGFCGSSWGTHRRDAVATEQQSQTGEITKIRLTSRLRRKRDRGATSKLAYNI